MSGNTFKSINKCEANTEIQPAFRLLLNSLVGKKCIYYYSCALNRATEKLLSMM